MALDFPASSASPFTAPNGVVYTWNADGYWEAQASPSDYLKLDATNGPVTGPLTFEGTTTHGDGIEVTGGNFDNINTGLGINEGLDVKAGDNFIAIKEDSRYTFSFVAQKNSVAGQVIGSYFHWKNTGNFTGPVYGIQSDLGSQGFSSSNNVSAFFAVCKASNNISSAGVVSGFSCDVRNTGNNGSGDVYSIYSYGSAPSYFKGDIQCDGNVNGSFSLRMQSDDPAAFTTTYSTDDEGNEVSNSVYQGTTEDLLSVIKDLRARVTALEADHMTLMNNNNGGSY
jgi:hypothetical protein